MRSRLLAVAVLLLPGTAGAATVGVGPARDQSGAGSTIVFEAAPGEANRLTVGADPAADELDRMILFTDTGATLVPGQGCTAVDIHTARCHNPGPGKLVINLGDEDDTATYGDYFLYGSDTDAGPGDDTVTGKQTATERHSGEQEVMNGGGGRDTLSGGTGDDELIDGDTEGAVDADVLDGGDGNNTISYAGRTSGVTVDLSNPAAPAGEPGEGDKVRNFVTLLGGAGDDTLTGGPSGREVSGGDGNDRLSPGSGNATLYGGDGDEVFTGGPSSDSFRPEAGHDAFTTCGGGVDDIVAPDPDEVVPVSCESITIYNKQRFRLTTRPAPVRIAKGVARFRTRCPVGRRDGSEEYSRCKGSIALRGAEGGALAGRYSGHLGRPRNVKLTKAGRTLARTGGLVQVTVTTPRTSFDWLVPLKPAS